MPPDEYLGPYLIGELLGRGGMGNVYRGTHAKTGDRVAVKLIAAHVSDDPRFRRRFDREIRALKMLRHPGIVRIIGEGEDDHGRLFYSMELIEGETLQLRIRRLKKLPWQEVIDIGIQICSALKHAHDIGVTHRDLKPANLIFTADGNIKLVDFGIPKVFGDHGEQTQTGSILGTPDYMAPEQAGGEPITPRTDIYSLGSVMYACLVGRAPFKGKNSTEVIDAVRRDRPVSLELVDPELPTELVELVHQMLEKDPDKRPPTALSISNRLKAMRSGLPNHATVLMEDSATDIHPISSNPTSNNPTGNNPTNTDPTNTSSTNTNPIDTSGTSPIVVRLGDTVGGDEATSGLAMAADVDRSNPQGNDVSCDRTILASEATRAADATAVPSPVIANQRTVSGKSAKTVRPGELSVDAEPKPSIPSMPESSASALPVDAPENGSSARARFSTVSDVHDAGRLFDDPSPGKSASLRHSLAIAAMVSALIGFAFLAYRTTRPATADQIYETVLSTHSIGSMESFLRRFPDDDRFGEVTAMRMQKRIATTMRRLNAQKTIGLKPLSPAEEGFLAAMSRRHSDPDDAASRLSHWIDAFGGNRVVAGVADPSDVGEQSDVGEHSGVGKSDRNVGGDANEAANRALAELVELARYERRRLESPTPAVAMDPRAAELIQEIRSAADTLGETAASRKLRGIIETFKDVDWAKPAVEEAERTMPSP